MKSNKTTHFQEQGRPLSATLSKIILQAEEDNRHILMPKDFVDFYHISDGYARKMIVQLVKAGWLIRLGPGEYQLQPAKTGLDPYPSADKFIVAGQLSRNDFIAYGSAAEYHGLTTQIFQSVMVATLKRNKVYEGPPVRIEYFHVAKENFIGFQNISKAPNVRIASVERTLIDAVDRSDLCGGISDLPEIFRRASQRAQIDKILEYLPSYHSKSLVQRIGFMLQSFGYPLTTKQERYLQKWSQGNTAYLFAKNQLGTDTHDRYSAKWRLMINAPGFISNEKNRA
jgi:predicted transcriptional regulator of viral defense system